MRMLLTVALFMLPAVVHAAETYNVSRTDMNRIICTGDVESVYVSEEKGLSVSTHGTDVYVKFPVRIVTEQETQDTRTHYADSPAEMFVVCGETHSLILNPAKVPAQTILLKKEGDEAPEYKGKDEEEVLSILIKALVEESVPASFKKKEINRLIELKRGERVMNVVAAREYIGGGYVLREYHIHSVDEVTLLPSELSVLDGVGAPLAAMLMSETFKGWVRAFVIERGTK